MTGEALKDQELAEFAEPVEPPEEAEPAFREGLRERLWKLVRRQLGRDVDEPTGLD